MERATAQFVAFATITAIVVYAASILGPHRRPPRITDLRIRPVATAPLPDSVRVAPPESTGVWGY